MPTKNSFWHIYGVYLYKKSINNWVKATYFEVHSLEFLKIFKVFRLESWLLFYCRIRIINLWTCLRTLLIIKLIVKIRWKGYVFQVNCHFTRFFHFSLLHLLIVFLTSFFTGCKKCVKGKCYQCFIINVITVRLERKRLLAAEGLKGLGP